MSVSGYESQPQPFAICQTRHQVDFANQSVCSTYETLNCWKHLLVVGVMKTSKTMIGRKDADGGSTCVTRTETTG